MKRYAKPKKVVKEKIYEIDFEKFTTIEDVIAMFKSWNFQIKGTAKQLEPIKHFIKIKEDDKEGNNK